jgi:Mce-associated membrane protein
MSEPTPPPGTMISDTSQPRQPKSVRDHAREQTGSGRPRGPLALLAVAAAIAAVGVTLTVAGARLRAPAANRALADEAATRQVISAVSGEVQAIFSYSYADIGATRRAAASALAKSAARQYRLLFSQVQTHGQAEKLTLTSRVVRAGVIRLNSGSAELLLFLDQKWVRGTGQPVAAAAQLDIMAQLFGGRWRITAISAR